MNKLGPSTPPAPPLPTVKLVAMHFATTIAASSAAQADALCSAAAPVNHSPVGAAWIMRCWLSITWGSAQAIAPVTSPPSAGRSHVGMRSRVVKNASTRRKLAPNSAAAPPQAMPSATYTGVSSALASTSECASRNNGVPEPETVANVA